VQLQKGRRKLAVRYLSTRPDGVQRIGVQFLGRTAGIGRQVNLVREVLVELCELGIWCESNGRRDVLWIGKPDMSLSNEWSASYRDSNIEDTNESVRPAAACLPTHLCAEVISNANSAIHPCGVHEAHNVVHHLRIIRPALP
jgi:hypothetical protein